MYTAAEHASIPGGRYWRSLAFDVEENTYCVYVVALSVLGVCATMRVKTAWGLLARELFCENLKVNQYTKAGKGPVYISNAMNP